MLIMSKWESWCRAIHFLRYLIEVAHVNSLTMNWIVSIFPNHVRVKLANGHFWMIYRTLIMKLIGVHKRPCFFRFCCLFLFSFEWWSANYCVLDDQIIACRWRFGGMLCNLMRGSLCKPYTCIYILISVFIWIPVCYFEDALEMLVPRMVVAQELVSSCLKSGVIL